MKWSWKIGSVAGIGIYLHVTFLVLLGWVALSHYLQRHRWDDAASGLGFIVALFAIVVLHELGHALTAKRFGIRTRDITLLPIGGVARLERIPDEPKQELLVALAGPAVNVVLAVLLLGVLFVGAGFSTLTEFKLVGGHFLVNLMWVNIILAVFNLLPAFPMDGGRVLRALLAMRMDYVRATNIAARIGQGMAWVFGFIGLFTNPFLIFIALFVWIGAAQEAGLAQTKSALAGLPVEQVMITDFRTLVPGDTLTSAVEHVLSGCQQDFPVVENRHVVGVLTRTDLLSGLAKHGPPSLVGEVMQRKICTVQPTEMVESVLNRLQENDCRTMPVVQDGELVGIVTSENLGEYLMIQAALEESLREKLGGRRRAVARVEH
ncbi:MAG: site-2 protease family protein [Verrucomicrobia bacterium]|nr:site-2 protease family protein [Verrucomicrobiota bacterium]